MSENVGLPIDVFTAITKALSDSNRVRAFCALGNGELCVCQITELLGLAPSTISKHMSILKQAGLIDSRKDGKWVYYRLAQKSNGVFDSIIKLSLSTLEHDSQVCADYKKLSEITSIGLETLCKRQRCGDENS